MKKIGIAGIGGIGSNIAVQLVRSGIRQLTYGDFDVVSKSNLNRQFYFYDQIGKNKVEALKDNLIKICPTGAFNYELIRLDKKNIKDFFKDCEVIIEGFDNRLYKKILIETLLPLGKTVISASGIGGFSCDNVKVRKLASNFYVVGDFVSDIKIEKTYGHKVVLVASLMTELVLKECGYFAK
ncbi:sulfur carrier protein ThiS adenylyltransferase ThiF [Fusobacterium sp. PH5-44]|uniref:sulfur carrier protein ThiS adenylyltransferase ThiF n=1 Tax=unclassified Fusobacterium TaxID=2648384 RepID=UPI003D246D2F